MDTTRFDDDLRAMLDEVESDRRGEPSDYLEDVAGQHVDGLAVAVCTVDGHQAAAGETEHAFALQSVSKALTYAVVLQEIGLDHVLEHVGVEPSGESFNHLSLHDDGRPCNPLINAGAILVHSLLPAGDEDERTALLLRRYSALAGVELEDGSYETVAGYVLDRLGRVAEGGERVTAGDHVIEVCGVEGHRITRVRVMRVEGVIDHDDEPEADDKVVEGGEPAPANWPKDS